MRADALRRAWAALPEASLSDILGDLPALVLAPHPDDETLGCGGLIATCCAADRPPLVVILTDGAGSHPGSRDWPPARLAALRRHEVAAACAELGLPPDRLVMLGARDGAAPHDGPDFADLLDRLVELSTGCGSILATWRHDPHGDHLAAWRLAAAAAQVTGLKLLAYPVWGWLLPDETMLPDSRITGWRLPIGAHLAAKRRAIAAHGSQVGGVVTDSQNGFALPPELVRAALRDHELYLAVEPPG